MSNDLVYWIEDAAGNEPIEAAVVGWHEGLVREQVHQEFAATSENKVLPWGKARAYLKEDFNNNHGRLDYPPVYAWTATKVLFVTQDYDSEYTWIASVPRSPVDCTASIGGN